MHAMNNSAASHQDFTHGILAGKSNGHKKHRRDFGTADDDGAQRNRSGLSSKRAARQQAVRDETDMDLRNARMGLISFDDNNMD